MSKRVRRKIEEVKTCGRNRMRKNPPPPPLRGREGGITAAGQTKRRPKKKKKQKKKKRNPLDRERKKNEKILGRQPEDSSPLREEKRGNCPLPTKKEKQGAPPFGGEGRGGGCVVRKKEKGLVVPAKKKKPEFPGKKRGEGGKGKRGKRKGKEVVIISCASGKKKRFAAVCGKKKGARFRKGRKEVPGRMAGFFCASRKKHCSKRGGEGRSL